MMVVLVSNIAGCQHIYLEGTPITPLSLREHPQGIKGLEPAPEGPRCTPRRGAKKSPLVGWKELSINRGALYLDYLR